MTLSWTEEPSITSGLGCDRHRLNKFVLAFAEVTDDAPVTKEDLKAALSKVDAELEGFHNRVQTVHDESWAAAASETLHRLKTLTIEAVSLASLVLAGAGLVSHEAKGFLNDLREPERPAMVEPKVPHQPERHPSPKITDKPQYSPPDKATVELLQALQYREVLVKELSESVEANDISRVKTVLDEYHGTHGYERIKERKPDNRLFF